MLPSFQLKLLRRPFLLFFAPVVLWLIFCETAVRIRWLPFAACTCFLCAFRSRRCGPAADNAALPPEPRDSHVENPEFDQSIMLQLRKVIVAICVSPVLGRPLHDIRLSSQTQSPLANHVYPLTPHLFQTEKHQLGSSASSHSQAEVDAYYSPKPKQHLDYPEFVVLHFGAHGGVPESTIAIPLRKRISPCKHCA